MKKITSALKAIAVLSIVAGVATSGFEIKQTNATLTSPTGRCGFILTNNYAGMAARVSDWQAPDVSTIGVIDFDTGTVNYDGIRVPGFNTNEAISENESGSSLFSITSGSFAGHYILTVTSGGKLNLVSTNSGNTILITEVATTVPSNNGPLQTGICQAL